MLLEFSQYLEKYLWPFFSKDVSIEHLLSIISMLNEKERQDVSIWQTVKKGTDSINVVPYNIDYFYYYLLLMIFFMNFYYLYRPKKV